MADPGGSEPAGVPHDFSYDELAAWHEKISVELLEPARTAFVRVLNEALDEALSDSDRIRIRVSSSRIKSVSRLWAKMLREKYAGQITDVDSIPNVIDDLVGVRITCNNLSDIDTVRRILTDLPAYEDDETFPSGVCTEPESESRYNEFPKESGYRAYHLNLWTLVGSAGGWRQARGELQVRTLLQDGWGELTHEDTYKPGSEMPVMVSKLARRMADLLATVDDLAQDLRNELDQMGKETIAENGAGPEASPGSGPVGIHTIESSASPDDLREALLAETQRVVYSLSKPAELAAVAQQVQANFGRGVVSTWGGFDSFKDLVMAAAPDAAVLDVPPGHVFPPGMSPELPDSSASMSEAVRDPTVPAIAYRLKAHDKSLPAVPPDKLRNLLDILCQVLERDTWDELEIVPPVGIRELNKLSKYGRDLSRGNESAVPRPQLDFLLKSLYFSGNLRPGLSLDEVGEILNGWLYSRALLLGVVLDPVVDRDELSSWIDEALRQHP